MTNVEIVRAWMQACNGDDLLELPPDRVLVMALLRLKGLRSGIWVEHRWAYLFAVRDGKLVRQDGFNSKADALEAAGVG